MKVPSGGFQSENNELLTLKYFVTYGFILFQLNPIFKFRADIYVWQPLVLNKTIFQLMLTSIFNFIQNSFTVHKQQYILHYVSIFLHTRH